MSENAGGRPTLYEPEFAAQAEKLCRIGATDAEVADFFGVSVRTVHRWKHDHDDFRGAMQSGKDSADDRVERSLYQKAVGYDVTEQQVVKMKNGPGHERVEVVETRRHVPAETTAAIFWLKNRRKDQWRDKQELQHSGGPVTVVLQRFAKDQRDAAVAAALRADE